MARLGDVIEQVRGVSYKPEDLHDSLNDNSVVLLRANNIRDGKLNFDEVIYIDKRKVRPNQYLKAGDILVCASSGSKELVGKAAFVQNDMPVVFGAFCKIVRPNVEYPKYIGYFFDSPSYRKRISAASAGANINNIRSEHIDELSVHFPALERQHHIVAVLDKVSELIALRKQQLAKLDELVKARFVEMFGDPITNPKGWDMPLIEDVVANEKNALKAGPFGSVLKKEYYVDTGYKIYGQEQVISGDHTFGDYYIDEDRYKSLENCAVQAGDVLISLVGTYGKLLVMPEEFEPGIINPRLMKITFDKKRVDPYYFQYYFQSDSLKKALAENTHGGTMDILNLGIVRKLAMPLPPLELQNEFLQFVEQTDKAKLTVQQSLDKLETLKKALMQEYFG